MADSGSQIVVPDRTVNQHVPALTIVIAEGHAVQVPLTAQDNLLLSQVRVAHLREVLDKQIKFLKAEKHALKPIELKMLVDSFDKVEEMGRYAYAPGLNEAEGGEKAGAAAAQMAKAMAEGIAAAGHKAVATAKEDRHAKMKQILSLGKAQKKAQPVEIVPAEIVPENVENW